MEELKEMINSILLRLQNIEDRITTLEKGEFGTGIYLDGCADEIKSYLNEDNKDKNKEENK